MPIKTSNGFSACGFIEKYIQGTASSNGSNDTWEGHREINMARKTLTPYYVPLERITKTLFQQQQNMHSIGLETQLVGIMVITIMRQT